MPKIPGVRKVLSLQNVPVGGSIRVRTIKRTRGKNGRAKSIKFKTSYDPPPPEPPELPAFPQQLSDEVVSDGEADKQQVPPTRKGPSRAVSASFFLFLSRPITLLTQPRRN